MSVRDTNAAASIPTRSIGGRYRLLNQIGAGGMGVVYRARDWLAPPERQIVALKRLTTDAANLRFGSLMGEETRRTDGRGEGLRVALALEFQTLASLRHPNIIRVLDYGFDHALDVPPETALPYLVMDFLDDARTLIDAGRMFAFADKIDLLVQMLGALVYLHRRGILHRDLKPENVMVVGGTSPDDPPTVKVLDFGLAISRQASDGESGRAVGTLSYMAPEILAGNPPTEASDLYAVGVMAYELLAGAHPFPAPETAAFIRQVMRDPPDLAPLSIYDTALFSNLIVDFTAHTADDTTTWAVEAPTQPADTVDIEALPPVEADDSTQQRLTNAAPPLLTDVIDKLLAKQPKERYHDAERVIRDLCAAARVPPPAESDAVRESYLQAARFVGRDRELDALSDALEAARMGKGSAWLIGGESGIGKSRLVDELRIRALVRGAFVLRGQAENATDNTGVPFQMWRDPLRRLIMVNDDLPPDAQPLSDADDLNALIARCEWDSSLNAPPPPESLRDRIIGALTQRVEQLTRADDHAYPVAVLLLEDIHWAGESIDVLKALTGAARTLPFLIVATYRDDEAPNLPAALPNAHTLTLTRFSPAQIAKLSEAMLGEGATTAGLRDLLERETEGNAFFLVEVMRALAEEAGGLSEVARKRSLPARVLVGGVQQVVRRRLNRVLPAARGLLRLAAIMGRMIDAEALAYAAVSFGIDLGSADIETWLVECGSVAVLESIEGKWRFAHDKLRETLLTDVPPDDARVLHRQAAAALEAVHPGRLRELAGVLAGHWRAADDSERERHYLIDAAGVSSAAQDYRAAGMLYARALRLRADELANDPDDARAKLHLEWARAAFHMGKYDDTLTQADAALDLFRAADDRFNVAEALTLIGEVSMRRGDLDRADALFAETLALRRAVESPLYIGYSLMNIGGSAYLRGDYVRARRLARSTGFD